MSRVLLIDNEDKSIEEIKKILLSLDSKCVIETFNSLQTFETASKDEATDFFKYNLIIMEYQLAKFNEWEAWLTQLRTKVPTETVICFTSYDVATINRKHILNLGVFNLLYKPYDPLILKESLNMAVKTSESVKEQIKPLEMKPQVSTALVGILKEVDLLSICDLGFITPSDTQLPVGSFSKYYSKLFSHDKKQSIWAQCIESVPNPAVPNSWMSKFHFVGIEAPVLMKIRKFLQENKSHRVKKNTWVFDDPKIKRQVTIAIIDMPDNSQAQLKTDIEARFKNVTVDILNFDPEQIQQPYAIPYDCMINLNPLLAAENLKTMFKADIVPLLFMEKAVTDDQFKELLPSYRDIFKFPLDRSYFYKKLKILLPDLQCMEMPDVINITSNEKLKAANLVKVTEICELYLVFTYHREMAKQTYREFAFITEDENQMIQLPAFCSFAQKAAAEPGKSGVSFTHQFTFWGTTDHFLKQIRIWLLHNYIEQNKGES